MQFSLFPADGPACCHLIQGVAGFFTTHIHVHALLLPLSTALH